MIVNVNWLREWELSSHMAAFGYLYMLECCGVPCRSRWANGVLQLELSEGTPFDDTDSVGEITFENLQACATSLLDLIDGAPAKIARGKLKDGQICDRNLYLVGSRFKKLFAPLWTRSGTASVFNATSGGGDTTETVRYVCDAILGGSVNCSRTFRINGQSNLGASRLDKKGIASDTYDTVKEFLVFLSFQYFPVVIGKSNMCVWGRYQSRVLVLPVWEQFASLKTILRILENEPNSSMRYVMSEIEENDKGLTSFRNVAPFDDRNLGY